MLLALRGVDTSQVEPEFAEALRFGLFAERVAPMLVDAEQVQATEMDKGMSAEQRLRLGRAKMEAADQISRIRTFLYPEGD